MFAGVAANLTSLIVSGAFTIFIFAFMLADSGNMGKRIRKLVPADSPFLISASAATSSVGTYMLILTVVNLIIAVLDMIFLWILGIPHVLLWGVLAFIFGYVPYIGYWVSIIPPLIIGFVQGGVTMVIIIIVGYWFINGMISTVIAPRFYGKGLNLSSECLAGLRPLLGCAPWARRIHRWRSFDSLDQIHCARKLSRHQVVSRGHEFRRRDSHRQHRRSHPVNVRSIDPCFGPYCQSY